MLALEDFSDLVAELIWSGVVRTPWTLVAGELSANAPLAWTSVLWRAREEDRSIGDRLSSVERQPSNADRDPKPPPWGHVHESVRVLARDDDHEKVLPALQAAPYGTEDVAVVFRGLDSADPDVSHYVGITDKRIILACFALARPQLRPLATDWRLSEPGGAAHQVQTFVSLGFKESRDAWPNLVAGSAMENNAGAGLVIGKTWG